MSEPRQRVRERDGGQCVGERIKQRISGARFGRAQGRLDFRPTEFNRIQVGRIGWQEFQVRSNRFDQGLNAGSLVKRQVIHQNNIAWAQGRKQNLLDVHFKSRAIHCTFQDPRSLNVLSTHGGEQRIVETRIAGRPFHDALPRSSTSELAGEPQIHPAFIDEFQVSELGAPFLGNPLPKLAAKATDARGVFLAIMERLFFAADANAATRGTWCWD